MDAEFQEQYVAAEQAYSAGDFGKAEVVARQLLVRLDPLPVSGAERDATLAWRSFVALLLGHISLYGKDDVVQGEEFYRLVLASEPQDTLRELAQQGLNEALERSPVVAVSVSTPEVNEFPRSGEATNQNSSNDLTRDPFLNSSSTRASDAQRDPEEMDTAMPWLKVETQQSRRARELKKQAHTNLQKGIKDTSTKSTKSEVVAELSRLEAGLLRVVIKDGETLESSTVPSPDDNQSSQPLWLERLGFAWRSLRRS